MNIRIGTLVRSSKSSKVYEVVQINKNPKGDTVWLGRADHRHPEGSSRSGSHWFALQNLTPVRHLSLVKNEEDAAER